MKNFTIYQFFNLLVLVVHYRSYVNHLYFIVVIRDSQHILNISSWIHYSQHTWTLKFEIMNLMNYYEATNLWKFNNERWKVYLLVYFVMDNIWTPWTYAIITHQALLLSLMKLILIEISWLSKMQSSKQYIIVRVTSHTPRAFFSQGFSLFISHYLVSYILGRIFH
jgi:hypothetical protein